MAAACKPAPQSESTRAESIDTTPARNPLSSLSARTMTHALRTLSLARELAPLAHLRFEPFDPFEFELNLLF